MTTTIQRHPTMCDTARYAIRVRGGLNASWSDRFDDMIVSQWRADNDVMTLLVGTLRDQSALLSVLTSLDDLGLPLLSVGFVPQP
jgi:hypothetical protein